MGREHRHDQQAKNDERANFDGWRFGIGFAVLFVGAGFAFWGFSKDTLQEHQRDILTWILPLAAGVSAGAFAGSLSLQSRKLIPGVAITATSGFAVWLVCFFYLFPGGVPKPLVLLMDSTLPAVVYDPETRKKGGTNADDISQVLDDLPLRIHVEKTSLVWRRDQQVKSMNPDLIVIHLSSFYHRTNVLDSDRRFRSFLQYMEPTRTKFLVYTRGLHGDATPETNRRWDQTMKFLHDVLPMDRVKLFSVEGGANATFRNPKTGRDLKREVQLMLDLT